MLLPPNYDVLQYNERNFVITPQTVYKRDYNSMFYWELVGVEMIGFSVNSYNNKKYNFAAPTTQLNRKKKSDKEVLQASLSNLISDTDTHWEYIENPYNRPLKTTDRFIYKDGPYWEKWDAPTSFAGQTPTNIMKRYGYSDFAVAVQKKEGPRFPCNKPFPFGY